MGCEHTSVDRLLQVVNGTLLRGGGALVVVQPAKLLENLGVLGVALENTLVGRLCAIKLEGVRSKATKSAGGEMPTSFCCSWTWPIWNQMSSSVKGLGGELTMYLKH